jgi:carbon-monoxide dehydrogenase large subunit
VSSRFVGQRVARKEDARLLTGHGRYVDDVRLPGTLHTAFARSTVAKGTLTSIDVEAARALPGVVAVYLAGDIDPHVHDHLCDGEAGMAAGRPFRVLADGDVRFVGEPIAMVVAESRYVAEDAVELIEIDIEPARAIVDYTAALDDGAPVVHPGAASNLMGEDDAGDGAAVDELFASAAFAVTETYSQHRYLTVPMEARALLASWDPASQELLAYSATQGPHGVRSLLARVLGIDDSRVRVIAPDVGGSFGLKMNPAPEEIGVAVATVLLGRPVKWIQDRTENLAYDDHPREDRATVTIAADAEGRLLAARADYMESSGAFPRAFSSAAKLTTMLFPGPYRIDAFASSSRSVFTNTSGRGSYRGPWMFEAVVREQVLDRLAREVGIDPLELRRRNVITEDELPYTMTCGMVYDQMTAARTLEQAAEIIGYDDFRAEQARAREEGRYLGIGIALDAEPTAMAFGFFSTDAARVSIQQNGKVDVLTTAMSHGQSYETTLAQVVADELGIDIDDVRIRQGDTDAVPVGQGTGGSRSSIPVTAARNAAHELRERIVAIVAHALEASPEDIELVDGRAQVVGAPTQGMSIAQVAEKAYTQPWAMPPGVGLGLEAQSRWTPGGFCTWANSCHICTVEVDPDTGAVSILRFVVSEDCGVMINPNVVEGQIAGGVVQGIGGALFEEVAYDEDGNPLTTTFVDYLLPTATEVPDLEYGHVETHAPTNPGGHKGLGEGGAINSPAAVINAVSDALAPLGITINRQPLSPSMLSDLIAAAG